MIHFLYRPAIITPNNGDRKGVPSGILVQEFNATPPSYLMEERVASC